MASGAKRFPTIAYGRAGVCGRPEGFTLIETSVALFILVFGLLAAGQMIFVAASSASLARSKGSAITVAGSKLAYLADLYGRDPEADDLSAGSHGPEPIVLLNPATNSVLNRFSISWTIEAVADPRAGVTLKAKLVRVIVTPTDAANTRNLRARLNKAVSISTILSAKAS